LSDPSRYVPAGLSFVITSCGRFDLLEQTLKSFFSCNTHPIDQFLLVEDSGRREVLDVLRQFPVSFEVILNETPMGQMGSIDLAYAKVSQPLIFHCEDDWGFFRPGLLDDSIKVLEALPNVSMVSAIATGILDELDDVVVNCPLSQMNGVDFFRIPIEAHPLWFGYSLNPGLRRTSDYRKLGNFSAIGHEPELSLYFKSLGMSIAVLKEPAYTHIGEGRHVPDPVAPIEKSSAFLSYFKNYVLPEREKKSP
jgi:hypothetical protein